MSNLRELGIASLLWIAGVGGLAAYILRGSLELEAPPAPSAAPAPAPAPPPLHLARTTEMCERVFTKEETQRLLERCDRDHGFARVEWREFTCWRSRQDFGYNDYPPPLWRANVSEYPEETHHADLPDWAERALRRGQTIKMEIEP